MFYQKHFCNFSSIIIVLKSTTDDLKVSLTSIWVVFVATVLEKVGVLVSTIVINYSLRDTMCTFTNILSGQLFSGHVPKYTTSWLCSNIVLSFIWKCVLSLLPVNPNSNYVVLGRSFVILRFKDLTQCDPCSPW